MLRSISVVRINAVDIVLNCVPPGMGTRFDLEDKIGRTCVKRMSLDVCEGVRNGDGGQGTASGKRTGADILDEEGDIYGGQRSTVGKCAIANASAAFGNVDGGQGTAASKRFFADACDAAGEGDGGQRGASGKCELIDARDAVGNGYRGQRAATGKRVIADGGDAVGNNDGGQSITAVKRELSDTQDAVRNSIRFCG